MQRRFSFRLSRSHTRSDLRHDTRCYFNVSSKANMSLLNVLHDPSHRSLPFLRQDWLHGHFTVTSEHIRFFLIFSFSVLHFSVVVSVR